MNDFSSKLATVINDKFDKKADAVRFVCELLNLGRNVVYKRLGGQMPFTFEEACAVAVELEISIDQLVFSDSDIVLCKGNFYNQSERPATHFLKDMLEGFKAVAELANPQLYFASKGLPFFLYLTQPKLLAFKLFVWEISSWSKDRIHKEPFQFDYLNEEELALAAEINEYYCQMPSHEIWNSAILDSSFEQINYVQAVHLFKDRATINTLYEELRNSLNMAQAMASKGKKSNVKHEASFQLYHNQLLNFTNNVIYIKAEDQALVNWTFCDPDHLLSSDEQLCNRASTWLDQLIEQATNISQHSLKARNTYFKELQEKISEIEANMLELAEF